MLNIALIIAGGAGTRTNQSIPKQFLSVNDKPLIIYTLEKFQNHPDIDIIEVVCIEGWESLLKTYAQQFNIYKLQSIILGGINGQESIKNGVFELRKKYNDDDIILIHDSVRPMVSDNIITNCINTTNLYGNSIACIPCNEAILEIDNSFSSKKIINRDSLKRTQTPQGFKLAEIYNLHQEAIEKNITNSVASCTLMIELGKTVYFTDGNEKNIKITTMDDIDIFKALLLNEHTR